MAASEEIFRMYLGGRTSGSVGLSVEREGAGELKEDSQVSSLRN